MTTDTENCLLKLPDCGRTPGNPICPKCGLDERVRYTTQEAMMLAKSQAQAQYWQNHAQSLQTQLKQAIEPPAPPPPSGGRKVGDVFQDLPTAPQMVVLPSGSFLMGSADDDVDGCADERPQHKVTIAYKLAMGRYPVTFEEWDACVADGGVSYRPKDEGWGRGKRPVIDVSWEDAQAYAAWLNKKLGIEARDPTRYRLPSEAEWEYACRAGTTGNYNTLKGQLSVNDATYEVIESDPTLSLQSAKERDRTTPVGIYAPNPWGLYDMHGNVCEWVQDSYEDSYRGAPTDGAAWETGVVDRVLRGGSWSLYARYARAAHRTSCSPDDSAFDIGFRLVRTTP